MKNISFVSCPISELPDKVSLILSQKFGSAFKQEKVKASITNRLIGIRTDLNVCIEYPYVDKLYRNTYYNYFSTKHEDYSRHSVRISFFKNGYDVTKLEDDNPTQGNECVGYFCLRPLYPAFFGRGLLAAECLDKTGLSFCSYEDNVVIAGKRFKLKGFPFAAQDDEYTKCAEMCIWEVLEYFGQKYHEHRAALPSEIIAALSKYSYERQVPSKGLFVQEISYALKEFNFGVRIYHRNAYNSVLYPDKIREFYRTLYYYVNSGLPIICILKNGKETCHGVVYIGYKKPNVDNPDAPKLSHTIKTDSFVDIDVLDHGDFIEHYVVIDDNRMSYQVANFTLSAKKKDFNYDSYYTSPAFENMELISFVVPLHPKMYLEASQAREFIFKILKQYPIRNTEYKPLYLRLFLTTGRSFKSWVAKEKDIDSKVRELIISSDTSKFIWVGELSNKALSAEQKAVGFVIIDATQTNVRTLDSLIFLYHPDNICYYENEKFAYRGGLKQTNPFNIYKNF